MTTIVSRLYADSKTAEQAVTALRLQNHPESTIDMIAAGQGAKDTMINAGVPEASAEAYSKKMSGNNALVVVRAPVTPFGAARNAMMTLDEFDSIDAGVANENYYVRESMGENAFMDQKVDRTHRHWATWGNERPRGKMSDAFGWKTVYSGTKFFGTFVGSPLSTPRKHWGNFVMPLISKREPSGKTVYSGTKYFGSFLVKPISSAGPYADVQQASRSGPLSDAR